MSDMILLIETATESCSVALSQGNRLLAEKYIHQPRAHASLLALYIQEILAENALTLSDCAAVAVSEGPGSYTGLRVGVSCAKGLCYGSGKPLIAVGTLACIAQLAIDSLKTTPSHEQPIRIIPLIDARRMEVYTATFTSEGEQISPTEALILDETSFQQELQLGKVLFTGNGAAKFQPLLAGHTNALFADQPLHASGMRIAAQKALQERKFADCAYFEPLYLKEFIAGTPKKLL